MAIAIDTALSVLLVEDDAIAAETLRMRFRDAGIALQVASEGYAAIEALRSAEYDAIVVDLIITGGLNGFGVLNYLELERPELLDRVFIVSGMSEQTIMNAAASLLPRFFRKPFDDRKLVQAIKKLATPVPVPVLIGPTVLVADDDAASRTLLREMIERDGLGVETAATGIEAISLIAARLFDAVILDLVMPEFDGFAVLHFLGETRPELLARTIITTGLPPNYRRHILTSKVFAVLEKPYDTELLRQLVEQCLANEKAPGVTPGAA